MTPKSERNIRVAATSKSGVLLCMLVDLYIPLPGQTLKSGAILPAVISGQLVLYWWFAQFR